MQIITGFDYTVILALLAKYGLRLLFSLLIFLIGKWVVGRICLILQRVIIRAKVDKLIASFIINAAKTILLIIVIIAALANLGIETTSFIAMFGAIGLGIGMTFKDSFSNVGAGILILFFRPFKIGDSVEIGGSSGVVSELNLFNMCIATSDGKSIIIPNKQVINSKIINFSITPTRRIDLSFSVDYKDDLKLAKELILNLAIKNELILKDPIPSVSVSALGEHSVDLVAKFWVLNENYTSAQYSMLESVKIAFDESGISIPYPKIITHHIYEKRDDNEQ
ncbi:small conductance mechanosensitive channel protein [Campylobacter porcelli]|uniref:Small conductance mechanosensitive channel protein n=1 Tax=Campylobacter porcelli TaxID=1660073 RepID=A0A1X9SVD5_9BACT|nr:small conductance mechanosensitive channel protein [Campylobacter sp. RM6137]